MIGMIHLKLTTRRFEANENHVATEKVRNQ